MIEPTTLDIILLMLAIFGLLTVLTIVGELMRSRLALGETDPVIEAFLMRIHTWWGLAIILSIAVLSGAFGVTLLFAFVSFAALREFLTFTAKRRADHLALLLAFFVILPLQYLFVWLDWMGLFTVFIPVYVFLLLPILSAVRGDPDRFLVRVAETQWGLMICVYCISHVPALLTYEVADGADRSILLIVFFAMVVQLADLFEYFAGRNFGHRKIAPSISPKTVVGVLVGVAAAALVGALLSWTTPFGVFGAAAMAALASMTGILGSIVFAAIKRDRGVKDWSHLIPGHGGFLDQLDGMIFAAPVFYHATHFFGG